MGKATLSLGIPAFRTCNEAVTKLHAMMGRQTSRGHCAAPAGTMLVTATSENCFTEAGDCGVLLHKAPRD